MSTSSYHINKQRDELKYVGDYKPTGSAKELARKIREDLQYPKTSKDHVIELLTEYRIRANMAWADVEDNSITQAEYEEALKLLNDNYADFVHIACHTTHQCKQCQNTFINEKGLCFAHEHAGKNPYKLFNWKRKRNRG